MDPLSLFGTILAVVQMIGMLASKMLANRNRSKHLCLELGGRATDLAVVLHELPDVAKNDKATAGVQQRLKDALDQAFKLIDYCAKGGTARYCCRRVAELDNVDKTITKCISDLMFISNRRGHTTSLVPDVHDTNNYYYNNAKGGLSGAWVGWPSPQHAGSSSGAWGCWPSPQHAGSTSQAYPPPANGWPLHVQYPGAPPYPAYGFPTAPSWDHGAHNSNTTMSILQGHNEPNSHAYTTSATTSGKNLEWTKEEHKEKHRLVEESFASARHEEAARADKASLNRAEEAAVYRLMEESRAPLLAEEAKRAEEAAMTHAMEESLASLRAEEAARPEEWILF